MDSSNRHFIAQTVGALSAASGVALLLVPNIMTRVYALPKAPRWLGRWLAARDVLIGVGMLRAGSRGLASVGRGVADLADFFLIWEQAHRSRGSSKAVRGRLLLALASAGCGFWLSTHAAEPDAVSERTA